MKYTVNNFRQRDQFLTTFNGPRIYRTTSTAYFGNIRSRRARERLKKHAPLVRQRSRSTIMASFPFLIVLATFKILGHYCAERMVPFSGEVATYIYIFAGKFLRRINVTDYAVLSCLIYVRLSTIFFYIRFSPVYILAPCHISF